MKEKIINWINSENDHIENQVLGIDGDFGTGKTTYINKVFDWKEIDKKIIYINLLNLDLNDNFIKNLIKIFNKSKNITFTIKEKANDSVKQIINHFKNKLPLKIDAFDDIKIIEKGILSYEKNKKKFFNECIVILDDIERINPQNILKALGLINQLSYKYKKMKILVPYNSKTLNDVLSNFFGVKNIENKENYLQKYLGNSINFEVDYDELAKFIIKIIDDDDLMNRKINSFIRYLKIINISWRDIILLKEHVKNISKYNKKIPTLKFLIETNGLSLFDKKIFRNNITNHKNSKLLFLKDNEKCYFDKKYSFLEEKPNLIMKLIEEKPWPVGVEKPNTFESTSEIKSCSIVNEEIYKFFKKYHNS